MLAALPANHVEWLWFLALVIPFVLLFVPWFTNGIVEQNVRQGLEDPDDLGKLDPLIRTCRWLALIAPIVCIGILVVWP